MKKEIPEIEAGKWLQKRKLQLTVAESSTGGLIGHRITNIPGSSSYFLGGVTAYAYAAKEKILRVRNETLVGYGAVSQETALEMASGVRRVFAGETPLSEIIGISVTGIAGPGGGMAGKPVGLVWIGMSTPEGDWAWKYIWDGNRLENKSKSADQAILLLVEYLKRKLRPGE